MTVNLLDYNDVSLGHAAWAYLHLDWHLFPLRPGLKVPVTPRGFKDAANRDRLNDVAGAAKMFSDHSLNIGLATGFTFDVLDVDVKNGAPGLKALATIRSRGLLDGYVAAARTPSGGLHLFYPASGTKSGYIRDLGLDFKAHGGYVVLAPSIVLDWEAHGIREKSYQWEWSGDLSGGSPLDWPAIKDLFGVSSSPRTWETDPDATPADAVAALADWFARTATKGERNRILYWTVNRAFDSGALPDDLYDLRAAARSAGLDDREIDRTIASAWNSREEAM